jgi:hypothetical protein
VIQIGEGPATTDRHEARVSDLREDHGWHSFCLHPPNTCGGRTRDQARPKQSLQTRWSIRKLVDCTEVTGRNSANPVAAEVATPGSRTPVPVS